MKASAFLITICFCSWSAVLAQDPPEAGAGPKSQKQSLDSPILFMEETISAGVELAMQAGSAEKRTPYVDVVLWMRDDATLGELASEGPKALGDNLPAFVAGNDTSSLDEQRKTRLSAAIQEKLKVDLNGLEVSQSGGSKENRFPQRFIIPVKFENPQQVREVLDQIKTLDPKGAIRAVSVSPGVNPLQGDHPKIKVKPEDLYTNISRVVHFDDKDLFRNQMSQREGFSIIDMNSSKGQAIVSGSPQLLESISREPGIRVTGLDESKLPKNWQETFGVRKFTIELLSPEAISEIAKIAPSVEIDGWEKGSSTLICHGTLKDFSNLRRAASAEAPTRFSIR